jgi:hypothetical protein
MATSLPGHAGLPRAWTGGTFQRDARTTGSRQNDNVQSCTEIAPVEERTRWHASPGPGFSKLGFCVPTLQNPLAESPVLSFLCFEEGISHAIGCRKPEALADPCSGSARDGGCGCKAKMLNVATAVYDKLAQRADRALNEGATTTTRRPDYVASARKNVESWDLLESVCECILVGNSPEQSASHCDMDHGV